MAEKTVARQEPETAARGREATREEDRHITPPVDIFETKDSLVVVADLPGVEPQTLDVRVAEGVLTLQAKTQHVAPGTPIAREYTLLHFFRQFELPEEVDVDRISAELKHGVLALNLPKKEKAKPKQIEVRVR